MFPNSSKTTAGRMRLPTGEWIKVKTFGGTIGLPTTGAGQGNVNSNFRSTQ